MFKYFEDKLLTSTLREEYLNSLYEFSKKDLPSFKDDDLILNELGYPIKENADIKLIDKKLLSKEDNCLIYRFTFLILGCIKLSGLYFEIDKSLPLSIMQHGYLGTPEIISSLYANHDSSNYNDIVYRLINLGSNVFSPQLLLWSIDEYGVYYNREELDAILRAKHSSLVAVETYCLNCIISYFKNFSYSHINMFGMSYGAVYTYYVSLINSDVKTYWGCSYLISNLKFIELKFSHCLGDVIKKSFKKNNLYLSYGDIDPIFIKDKTETLISELNDQKRITLFHGNHEVIKDDDFLKKII